MVRLAESGNRRPGAAGPPTSPGEVRGPGGTGTAPPDSGRCPGIGRPGFAGCTDYLDRAAPPAACAVRLRPACRGRTANRRRSTGPSGSRARPAPSATSDDSSDCQTDCRWALRRPPATSTSPTSAATRCPVFAVAEPRSTRPPERRPPSAPTLGSIIVRSASTWPVVTSRLLTGSKAMAIQATPNATTGRRRRRARARPAVPHQQGTRPTLGPGGCDSVSSGE